MSCSRGDANPNAHTKYQLWADSAGYCQNPSCNVNLFQVLSDKSRIHIAEIAHIVAVGNQGPRANCDFTAEERGSYDNLILLCPTCHSKIDKAPQAFPDNLIEEWKSQHRDALNGLFGVKIYDNREAVRAEIEPILLANRVVFEEYGPHRDEHVDPESDYPTMWRYKVRTEIIPNNEMCLHILSANRRLLNLDEKNTLELYRQHCRDFSARHTSDCGVAIAKQFPQAINSILE